MASLKRKSIMEDSYETPQPMQNSNGNGTMIVNDDEPVACLHDVSFPPGYVPSSSSTGPAAAEADAKPAKEFPFTLDPFQSEAIKCLNNGESVMVRFLLLLLLYTRTRARAHTHMYKALIFCKRCNLNLEVLSYKALCFSAH